MNLEQFFEDASETEVSQAWGSIVEVEIRNRIRVAVYAYAYEIENESLVSDAEFDILCTTIKPKMKTGHSRVDTFFRNHFDPSTGQWVHKHPELEKIATIYKHFYKRG